MISQLPPKNQLLARTSRWAIGVVGFFFFGGLAWAQNLSPLAQPPEWSRLAAFQRTITHDEFVRLLNDVYAPADACKTTIQVTPEAATIQTNSAEKFTLQFASDATTARPVRRYWQPATKLRDLHIALDPGHLGGRWAKMEERWFLIPGGQPVAEGDLTLLVARHLATRLRALGAEVSLLRNDDTPMTKLRPPDLQNIARVVLAKNGIAAPTAEYHGYADPQKNSSVAWQSELLFYRVAEIHARARFVNEMLRPDLVLCLHFNAEPWGDPAQPQLVDETHLHLLVNGCYSAAELALADVRFEMLRKLLNRTADEELRLSKTVADSLATATRLPPYVYHSSNAQVTAVSPYVWTRNLLASRLYACPVLYVEPYVMNSRADYERIQLGDYAGMKNVGGREMPSIFREYADAVADGLVKALTNQASPAQENVPK